MTRPMRKMTKKTTNKQIARRRLTTNKRKTRNRGNKKISSSCDFYFFFFIYLFFIIIPALWHYRKSANRIELISKLNTKHAELCGSNIPHTHRGRRMECRVKHTHRSTAARQLTLRCAADTDADCTNDSANSEPTEPRTSVPLSSPYDACMCVYTSHIRQCAHTNRHTQFPTHDNARGSRFVCLSDFVAVQLRVSSASGLCAWPTYQGRRGGGRGRPSRSGAGGRETSLATKLARNFN